MAFHQPTHQSIHRPNRPTLEQQDVPQISTSNASERQPEESQAWVLFAPATDVSTTSYLSETERSLATLGRSRLSDLGSLNTVARSELHVPSQPISALSATEDESAIEDDGELDSLDSHLPEFRSVPGLHSQFADNNQYGASVFPNHDGLGSFRLDHPAIGSDAQDHIYQFERFNPRRFWRRQDSFDLTHLDLDHEQMKEAEKRQRIETWRLEHSRILLGEIQQETRRRRQSQASIQSRPTMDAEVSSQRQAPTKIFDNTSWHDEDAIDTPVEPEGFLSRITRTVIQDLMGVDDRMLSILLGETIPDEEDLITCPRASQPSSSKPTDSQPWQADILERVSQELGLFVNRLSQHPGAFSTYQRVQQVPLPYAGLPVIPESRASHSPANSVSLTMAEQKSSAQFQPTIKRAVPPPEKSAQSVPKQTRNDVSMSNTFTQDEWEKDLDVKLVFKYLRSRFTSRSNTSPPTNSSHLTTSSTQDAAAKIARIRQHHPLVCRARPAERRALKATTPGSPVALRRPSSCASQSTRRSARRSSVSSRHYWDIGGSIGTGSLIASPGPMGSWGEV